MPYKPRLVACFSARWILGVIAFAVGCSGESAPSIAPPPQAPAKARQLPLEAIGAPSPMVAATATLVPGDVPAALWRSVARRMALLALATKEGDVLLGYDASSQQFVRISDAMTHVIAAAVLTNGGASKAPVVYYLRAPKEGVVLGRIALATGARDEIALGPMEQVVVGAADDMPASGLWIARTVGRRIRTAMPQWAQGSLAELDKKAQPKNAPPMWIMQWGAVDVVETLRQGGAPLAGIDVDWDQWGTASALRLRGLARTLPMEKFVDARGISWSPDGRWLLYRQWSDEVCDPAVKASLEIFDTLTATAIHVGELAPAGGFGWLGVATVFLEAPQGGRLVTLATNSDANGKSPAPRELGLWPQLRWPVRWRAPDCAAAADATAQ